MNGYIVAGGIAVAGLLLFFYFASRRKYRDPSAAPHYEKVRDTLTLREIEEPEVEKESSDSSSSLVSFIINIISGLFVLGIVCTMSFTMLGDIQGSLQIASPAYNASTIVLDNVTSPFVSSMNMMSSIFPIMAVIVILIILSLIIFNVFNHSPLADAPAPVKKKKAPSGKEHYSQMRDALTIRKKREDL